MKRQGTSISSALAVASILGLCCVGGNAAAQGFALDRYEPTAAGEWLFAVESPWYSATRWLAADLMLDYGHAPLLGGTFDSSNNFHQSTVIVEHQLVGHLDLAGSFLDRVLVTASLPVTLYESGTSAYGVSPLSGGAAGDPRLGAMVRVFGQPERDVLSIHLGASLWIPVGVAGDHSGDSNARGLLRMVLAGMAYRHLRWALDVGGLIRKQATLNSISGPGAASSEFQLGFGIGYSDLERRFHIGPELLFATGSAINTNDSHLEILVGGQYNIAKLIQIGLAVGGGAVRAVGTPDARVLFRIAYAPYRSEKAAPRPPDRDGDGIPDLDDACPNEAGPHNANPRQDGCPALPATLPMPTPAAPAATGDSDGDGVPDSEDQCPTQPAGDHPDALKKGCPIVDSDGDGIADTDDACPLESGPADADAKKNGCPRSDEFLAVPFAENQDDVTPAAALRLDAVVTTLKQKPKLELSIEGHSDPAEPDSDLAERRAQHVVRYLISQGVAARRLRQQSFAATKPLRTESSDEARAANRRVEIHLAPH